MIIGSLIIGFTCGVIIPIYDFGTGVLSVKHLVIQSALIGLWMILIGILKSAKDN